MTNRNLFAVPFILLAWACGGDTGPGLDPDPDPDPVTGPPSITSISPTPLLEGAAATISGTNFSTTLGANLVRIDGIQAVVTSATTTRLTVAVPRTCDVLRTGMVTVSVSNRTSPGFSVEIDPNAQIAALAVGEQAIFRDEGSYCIEIPSGAGDVQYLVGLQSTEEDGGTKSNVRMSGTVSAAAALASGPLRPSRSPSPLVSGGGLRSEYSADPGMRAYLRYRAEHGRLLQRNTDFLESLVFPITPRGAAAAPAKLVVTGSEQVGDRVELRIRDHTGGGCTEFETISAELKVKTAKAMWFVDVENPVPGYSAAELQSMADLFESDIRRADDEIFGVPDDQDGNGRVVVVITERINARNGTQFRTIAFVNPCDGLQRSETLGASNEGEFFYALAPDEGNEHGQQVSIDFLLDFMPLVMAHEYTHVIQFSRRIAEQANSATLVILSTFEAEGQATLAEEIVGHSILGNQPLQNYQGALVWDPNDVLAFDWYFNPFSDLAFYYGADPNATQKVDGAPEECTWTEDDLADPDPCLNRASWYGVTWSFLRWASDQVTLAGGDGDGVQKALINSRLNGFENLAAAFSSLGSLEDLLAQWAASLYTDERIAGAPNPRLTFPSWDLVSVENGVAPWARLEPRMRGFSGFSDNLTIRSPSTAYWLFEGSDNPAMTLKATSATGASLPDHIQMWVVRIR